jgi:hypothetical protein
MMKDFMKLALPLFALVALFSCQSAPKEEANWREENADMLARLYPNESTELAWIMREVSHRLEGVKKSVENGQKSDEDLESVLKTIHGAESIRSEAGSEPFKAFTELTVEAFKNFKENQSIETYNLLIANCVACHTAYCPGPLKKINTLKVYN